MAFQGRQRTLRVRRKRYIPQLGALLVWLGISTTLCNPLSARASTPPPKVQVARAAAVMDRIPWLAVIGTIRLQQGRQRSSLHLTGACDASAVPRQDRASNGIGSDYLKARAHMWGQLWGKPLDKHYIVIGHGALPRTWERSAQTHNQWKLNTTEGTALPILDMCSVLFMSPGGIPTNTPSAYANLGEVMLTGVAVWHVRMTVNPPGEHWRYDWYIDAQSFRVLRSITIVGDAGSRSTSTYDYSRFGIPVRITAPTFRDLRDRTKG